MTVEGYGYLQQNFEIRCLQSSCQDQPTINEAILAIRKLTDDLVRNDGTFTTYLTHIGFCSPLESYDFSFPEAPFIHQFWNSASIGQRWSKICSWKLQVFLHPQITLRKNGWYSSWRHPSVPQCAQGELWICGMAESWGSFQNNLSPSGLIKT